MAAFPSIGFHELLDGDRLRIELHFRSEFAESSGADSVFSAFLIPDDATGNMPARPVGVILPPGEQGAAPIVLDQQVDIDQRREAAEEEKKLLGQPVAGL